MKLDEKTNKNSITSNNKFDLKKNYPNFNHIIQSENSKININYINDKNINKMNVDPRLELTLKYLDILSTLDIFINNCISFNDLLLLSKKDLIELGFSLVERNRIFNFSQEYKTFGVKYNISEINDFFSKYENLNIRLVTNNNNYNKYNIKKKENNNENINHNFINNNFNNKLLLEKNKISLNSEKLEDKTKTIINQKEKQNNIYLNHKDNNKYIINKNKLNISSNTKQKSLHNNIIHQSRETNNQESMNTNQNNNKNNLLNSSKLIRQNSKVSKNSSYSKSSKSRYVTIAKNLGPATGGSGGSIIQKYQSITDEIDNYFKKYNEYKEQKKNRMKKYEIISTSYKRKNNGYNNPTMNDIMIKNNRTNDNLEGENINKNREDEINKKLSELQKRKKELKEKLNLVCERENKKLMIIKFLEEEDK